MKTKTLSFFAAVLMCATFAQGQVRTNADNPTGVTMDEKKTVSPPAAPQKIQVPTSPAKDALNAAIHKKDQADKAIADLNLQVVQTQQAIQKRFAELEAQQKNAQKAEDDARLALLKEMKLEPEKYDVNLETMEATAKQAPANEAKK